MMRAMRRLRQALLMVAAVFALPLSAEMLRVTTPVAGTRLHGGGFATLQWTPVTLPQDAEEWEAFLSVDGGKYYAFRITPHLDIERKRFDFIVPNVDTHDARILIRAGDEEQETLFEVPASFTIERDPNAEQALPALMQFGRGEAARAGDPEVLAWTEGARNGSDVRQQSSTTSPPASFETRPEVDSEAPPLLAPAAHSIALRRVTHTRRADRRTHFRRTEATALPVDLLLVCRRRNI
jgi:hypothetical protein